MCPVSYGSDAGQERRAKCTRLCKQLAACRTAAIAAVRLVWHRNDPLTRWGYRPRIADSIVFDKLVEPLVLEMKRTGRGRRSASSLRAPSRLPALRTAVEAGQWDRSRGSESR
jgi:hypothetical protein